MRSQRGLKPTGLALELHPLARRLALTAAALLRTASGHAGEISGTVRISASEVVGVEHLPPIFADLVRVLPETVAPELDLWVVMHDDLQDSARCRTVFDALAERLTKVASPRHG